DFLDLAAATARRPVDDRRAAISVELASEIGRDLLRDGRDGVDLRRRRFLLAEQRGEETAAFLLDGIQIGHGAGTVQGDAGLCALAAWFHQDGGDDTNLVAGWIDVDLAEGFDDTLELRHGGSSVNAACGLAIRRVAKPQAADRS